MNSVISRLAGGKKILVAGTGASGIAAARLLLADGADIIVYDGNEKACAADIRAKLAQPFGQEAAKGPGTDVPVVLGELAESVIEQVSIAVLSPGMPSDTGAAQKLREHGVRIWGEIELAYRYAKGHLAAITGTNGKTTTTALTGEILKSHFADVKVAGNIGIPYASLAAQMTGNTVTAAEISSFQLETIEQFTPDVSAILNITPDHLNRHHTMDCYAAVKESVTKNQKPGQACVLNYEDERLREFGRRMAESPHSLNVIYFSSKRKLERGFYLEDGSIWAAFKDGAHRIVHTGEMNLLGVHNYENAMAAAAVSHALGVPFEKIAGVLKTFQAVEHRIEYAGEIKGVRYYNDSKATNTDAAIQGILAMNRPAYLIGGGYDKKAEYGSWIDAFGTKVKQLVLIGETKEKIAKTAKEKGFLNIVMCETLEEAVIHCYRQAQEGEAVLLSPACASWDMFQNYEERGRKFKETVRGLQA